MMRIIALYILMLCLYPVLSGAQTPNWTAGGTGGSEGWAQAADPWGNVFEAGFNNPAGGTLIFGPATLTGFGEHATILVKYDPYGQLLWTANTNIGVSRPLGVAADQWGNAYLLAWYADTLLNVGPYNLRNPGADAGTVELYIAKYAPGGSVIWAKNLCKIVGDVLPYWSEEGNIGTNSTSIFIAGAFTVPVLNIGSFSLANADPADSTLDLFVARLDTAGNVLWAKSAGGPGDDVANFVAVTRTGNVYVTGTFASPSLTFGGVTLALSSTSSLFLAKYDSLGNVLWARSPSGSVADGSIATDSAENAYIVGVYYKTNLSFGSYTITLDSNLDDYFAKYDAYGNFMWAKKGAGNSNLGGYGIQPDPCGNVWATGGMEKDSFVIIDGNTYLRPPESRDPMFITCWSPAGNYISSILVPTGGDDVSNLGIDGVGNLYIGGDYWGGPYTIGSTTVKDPNHAYEDIMVTQYGTDFVHDTSRQATLACLSGGSVTLKAPGGYAYYRWDDGSTFASRVVSATGKYTLYATGKCGAGILVDVYTVAVGKFDTVSSSLDTSACRNAAATLLAPPGYFGYYWSNGGLAQKDTVTSAGTFTVLCEGNCTIPSLIDTFHVALNNINMAFSLGDDTAICLPMTVTANLPGSSFLWQDGTTADTDVAAMTGEYTVVASRNNCFSADSIFVDFLNLTQHLQDTIYCKNQPIELTLHGNVPPKARARWSTGSTTDSITVDNPGKYWVTVTEAACMGTDTMTLSDVECNCDAVFPGAFTPNDDGLNDYYFPFIDKGCSISNYTFCIYNRWGQMVYSTRDQHARWDGKFDGVKQDIGVYMYFVEYRIAGSLKPYIFKGDLTLVR